MIISIFGPDQQGKADLAGDLAAEAMLRGIMPIVFNGSDPAEWPSTPSFDRHGLRSPDVVVTTMLKQMHRKIMTCHRVASEAGQLVLLKNDPLYEHILREQTREGELLPSAAAAARFGVFERALRLRGMPLRTALYVGLSEGADRGERLIERNRNAQEASMYEARDVNEAKLLFAAGAQLCEVLAERNLAPWLINGDRPYDPEEIFELLAST
jgi:hypothetical protein